MRHFLMTIAVALAASSAQSVWAQTDAKADPKQPAPKFEPIPEPPPPPPGLEAESANQRDVVVAPGDKVEEVRQNGKVYMLKVTPSHGVPYYLVDERGDGTWARQESTDSGVRVPMWVIKSF